MKKLIILFASVVCLFAGGRSAQVQWNANPASENVTSYRVYQSTNSANFTLAASVSTTNAIVTNLNGATPYWFFVTAVNTNGESDPSTVVQLGPAPTVVNGTTVKGLLTLTNIVTLSIP